MGVSAKSRKLTFGVESLEYEARGRLQGYGHQLLPTAATEQRQPGEANPQQSKPPLHNLSSPYFGLAPI
jgi:hypothetical protein